MERRRERDLFSVRKIKPDKKEGKRKHGSEKGSKGDQKAKKQKTSDDGPGPVHVEALSYQRLMSGLVSLGCISNVTNYDIAVSLPFMVSGKVPITRISQAYTSLLKKVTESKDESCDAEDEVFTLKSLFKKGQYVVTKVDSVEKVENRHKVNLCLMPQEVNFGVSAAKLRTGVVLQCAVASVEDNGYVMETGIPGVKVAFLNRVNAEGAGIVGVGSVVRCLITKVKSSQSENSMQLILTAIPKKVNDAAFDVTDTEDLTLLLPGTAITTTIAKVEKACLKLIMAEADGVVSSQHLQSPLHALDKYEISHNVKARVLYLTPLSRILHLTLQKSIFSERSDEDLLHGLSLGDKKQGEVLEIQRNGIYFKIGGCRAFCARKYLSDKDNEKEDGLHNFPIGSQRLLRITSHHYFDETFVVSLQKSMMSEQTVGFSALKVGQVLKATIKAYDTNKAIANVATNVDGEIPFLHLTDAAVKNPEKKFAVGNSVDVRVLEVVPEKKRLVLTCKNLLVFSKEMIVSEYNKDLENTIRRGFVVQVLPAGLLVAFYNSVKGFVPKSKASTERVGDLTKKFTVGNVVKCKILSVNPEEKKMTLSLILLDEKKKKKEKKGEDNNTVVAKVAKVAKTKNELNIRTFVNCVVTKVEAKTVRIRIKPGNMKGEIPVPHLSDDKSQCKALQGVLSNGDHIHNAAVFKKTGNVTLTMKDSVCTWILTCNTNAQEQLKDSAIYPAVVSKVLPKGITVSVPVGKTCQDIHVDSEETGETPSEDSSNVSHAVGESVEVKCNGFGDDGQAVLSIESTDAKMGKRRRLQSLYNYLKHQMVLQKNLVRKVLVSIDFGEIQVGNKLEVDVVAVTSLGLLVKNKNHGIYGIVMSEHLQPDVNYEMGNILSVCVLHVHVKEQCVVLTAKRDFIDHLYVYESSCNIAVEMKARSEVLLVQKDFTLVKLQSRFKGLMVYLPLKKNAKIGQIISITVKHIEDKLVLGVPHSDKTRPFPVLSGLSSVQVHIANDSLKLKNTDVKIDETGALEKIKNIVFFSEKEVSEEMVEEEEAIVEEVVSDGKEKKIKENAVNDADGGVKPSKKKKKKKTDTSEKMVEEEEAIVEEVVSDGKEKKRKENAVNDADGGVKPSKKKKKKTDTSEILDNSKENTDKKDDDDSGVDENMDVDEMSQISKSDKPCLTLSTGFVWNVPENEGNEDDDSSGSEDDEDEAKKKKVKKLSKVERDQMAKEEEKRLHKLEGARLEKERLPQSALDYEELLQESPNSSAIWIQFISFNLENAEVDRARSVAQRALQVINVQEFEERINVWTVMLRLEVLYGTEDSINAAFGEALATNDPLQIYQAMAMVYAESNKIKEAEEIYFKMSKKFSSTFDAWIKAGIFFFKNNKLEAGRKYMDRALLSLDKTHHVNLINRFAQLEFQFGEVERARTMFESLLSNYPKRMDMWIVYIDLLSKRGDIEGARQVLERMTSLKLRLRQMRSVFKKFLEFEKTHGTPHSVESVKNRVQDYVTASLKQE